MARRRETIETVQNLKRRIRTLEQANAELEEECGRRGIELSKIKKTLLYQMHLIDFDLLTRLAAILDTYEQRCKR